MRTKTIVGVIAALWLFPAVAADTAKTSSSAETKPPFGNFLECTRFTWMYNCDEINKWVNQNPDKPLRVKKDGLEFYFPPGTPSATVDLVLNQTPEAAERYAQYLERSYSHQKKIASLYANTLEAHGGSLKGVDGIELIRNAKEGELLPKIKEGNVSMFVFYDSNCGACRLMEPVISDLHKQYPGLRISMLQLNNDPQGVTRARKITNVPTLQLTGDQLSQYKKDIKITPTIWIEDKRTQRKFVLEGMSNASEISRHLARISK